jgi:translation initiation factor IF-2
VKVAHAAGGVIIAFNVGTDTIARELADRDAVNIYSFAIIYELSTKVQELLIARIPSVEIEKEIGRAKVLKTFSSGAKKQVLGLRYVSGVLTLKDRVKVVRHNETIAQGTLTNLQQARADVKEIKTEGDFGAEIEARADATYGDELVAFVIAES